MHYSIMRLTLNALESIFCMKIHACRWTLFVREEDCFVVKAQKVLLRFVVLFYYYAGRRLSSVFFFPFFFAGGGGKSKNENCVGGRRILYLLFSLGIPADLTDLSLSFGTKRDGKKKKKKKNANDGKMTSTAL